MKYVSTFQKPHIYIIITLHFLPVGLCKLIERWLMKLPLPTYLISVFLLKNVPVAFEFSTVANHLKKTHLLKCSKGSYMSGVVLHDTPVERLVYLNHFSSKLGTAYQFTIIGQLKSNSGYEHWRRSSLCVC
jgi:hypothetical protein